jgi:hypothetical protein
MRHEAKDEDEEEKEFRRLTSRSSRHVSTYKSKPGKQQTRYVQVPLWWAERVANIRGASAKTMFVGIWLLHLKWKTGSNTFQVSNGQLAARGIGRMAKDRALRQLEAAGLITVERRNGKTPTVTLVLG